MPEPVNKIGSKVVAGAGISPTPGKTSLQPVKKIPTVSDANAQKMVIGFFIKEIPDQTEFGEVLHRLVSDRQYMDAAKLLDVALDENYAGLKAEQVRKDILTVVMGLSDDKSAATNASTVSMSLDIAGKCIDRDIIYEISNDNPKGTQGAIILGQRLCPDKSAAVVVKALPKGYVILPETIRITCVALSSGYGPPAYSQAYGKLVTAALDLYLGNTTDEDIRIVDVALLKFGNPHIQIGEKTLLDVAARVKLGSSIAKKAIEKKFPFLPAEKSDRLSLFSNDLRVTAIKLRLLKELLQRPEKPIRTNVVLTNDEMSTEGLAAAVELARTLDLESHHLLRAAIDLNARALQGSYRIFFVSTLLGTAKELALELQNTQQADQAVAIASDAIDRDEMNDKSAEMCSTYLAEQRYGKLASVKLTVHAHNKGIKFDPRAFGFISKNTRDVRLPDTIRHRWMDLLDSYRGKR